MKTSLKEIETFNYKMPGLTNEQFLKVIKNYNDCVLFSSEHPREVTQDAGHVHFLLKYIEELKQGQGK